MKPTLSNYKIPKGLTGYDSDQTINPSELTLWRVLQKNEDGTIDMISEYVSNEYITFKGELGYKNFIGVLNMIASAYTNSTYTEGSRCPGYNGQTEFISNSLSIETSGDTTPSSGMNSTEAVGGGDSLYIADRDLINTVLKGFLAYKVNTTTYSRYWFAYRFYYYEPGSHYWNGGYAYNNIYHDCDFYGSNGTKAYNSSIRPIVTLKSDLMVANGDGTEGSPWSFE